MKLNKKSKFFAITLGALLLFSFGCKKVKVGHLDPYLYYPQNPMTIIQGRTFKSFGINPNGSTRPMHVELLHVYDKKSGENVDDIFLKKYPLTIWTKTFNQDTDTTLALIESKRKVIEAYAVNLDSISGAVLANFNTIHLPTGHYTFDAKVTNVYGSRIYPKLGEIIIDSGTYYQKDPELGTPYNKLYQVGNETVSKMAEDPVVSIKYVADTPNVIAIAIVDKNGTPFNPLKGEIEKRPQPGNTPGYLQTLEDYAFRHSYTDTSMLFYYPVVPFPIQSLGNGFNIYYRIPTEYAHVAGFPDDMYSLNPRFVCRFWVPGKYKVVIKLPDVTHR